MEATCRHIQSICPAARIALLSLHWKDNLDYYARFGWQSAPLIWDVPLDRNKLKRLAIGAATLGGMAFPSLTRNPTAQLYQQASAILDVGGGMLFSSNRYLLQLGFYQHLVTLLAARKYGKPVIICPQSIGPFTNPIDRMAVRHVLARMTAVLARENVTSALLKEMGVRHSISPDIAFLGNFIAQPRDLAQRLSEDIARASSGKKRIGLTVLDWRWAAQHADDRARITRYLERICTALRALAQTQDLYVHVFAQVGQGISDNDARVSLEAADLLRTALAGTNSTVACAPEQEVSLDASDLCHLYGNMDVLIASRLHSAIFALLQDTPAIGLGYQPKTRGTFSLIGLDDWALDADTFAADELTQRCAHILEYSAVARQRVKQAVVQARAQVLRELNIALFPILSAEYTH